MGPSRTASGRRRPSTSRTGTCSNKIALDCGVLGDPADHEPGRGATSRGALLQELLHERGRVLAQVAAIRPPEHEIGEGNGGPVHRRGLYGGSRASLPGAIRQALSVGASGGPGRRPAGPRSVATRPGSMQRIPVEHAAFEARHAARARIRPRAQRGGSRILPRGSPWLARTDVVMPTCGAAPVAGLGHDGYDGVRAPVAQWIERSRPKAGVGGSNPSGGASGCLIPRAVRFPLCLNRPRGRQPPAARARPSCRQARPRLDSCAMEQGSGGEM